MKFSPVKIILLPALGLVLLLTIFQPSFAWAGCCWGEEPCKEAAQASQCENPNYFNPNDDCRDNTCDYNLGEVTVTPSTECTGEFCPQVPIPGMKLGGKTAGELIASYIVGIYQYGIWLAGGLAVIMIMAGGLMWLLAGGNAERVSAAKGRISAAILGLGLALASYLILVGINPKLVSLNLANLYQPDVEDYLNTGPLESRANEAEPLRKCQNDEGGVYVSAININATSIDKYIEYHETICRQLCQDYGGYKNLEEIPIYDAGQTQIAGKALCCKCQTPLQY